MSISTFMGIETALRGLLAQQRALDVTGHNIANANTEGYSRQTAQMVTTQALQVEPGKLLGTGVDVVQYQRIRDSFVDTQLRAQTMLKGSADAQQDGLAQVELVLGEPSDTGVNSLLAKFWSSWQDLGNAPENMATRQALVQSGTSLADGLSNLANQLQTIQSQTSQSASLTIDQVNGMSKSIASLNSAIANAVAVKDVPNDLRDQRDLLVDQLSQLGSVGTTENTDGTITLTFDGVTLVNGVTPQQISETATPGTITNNAVPAQTAAVGASMGKLGALFDLRDTTVKGYLDSLNTFAATLIKQVNALHGGGTDANGVVQTSGFGLDGSSGLPFFSGTDATTIAVAVAPEQIAAASATGQPGDASNALRIAQLADRGATMTPLANASLSGAYGQFVTGIGADSQEAQRQASNAQTLVDALTNRRSSISGVSIDEEMTNLVKFQRAYQASSRALNAIDDALDLLITRTGRAGL